MTKTIGIIFYISLTMSFILLILPPEITWGVYTPNYLGWFWLLVCLPTTLITFIWAGIQDIKNKIWRELVIRVLIFISILIISFGYWFYKAHESGNL
jgi:hypothetical protein